MRLPVLFTVIVITLTDLIIVSVSGATVRLYPCTVRQAATAITIAFARERYHCMLLTAVPDHYDAAAGRWRNVRATNEWDLGPDALPLTFVPKGKEVLPYFAEFDIVANQLTTNQCQILVSTISSWVTDGKEPGIHGGWAAHGRKVPPLLLEETNVLLEISKALASMQGGNTNALAPTPDTKTAMQYQMQQLKELNPNAEKDLREYLKAHAQSNNAASGK
jgi:hypothetical protein